MRGKLSCLLINDLDAGLGHFANTQVTVNNQVRSTPLVSAPCRLLSLLGTCILMVCQTKRVSLLL